VNVDGDGDGDDSQSSQLACAVFGQSFLVPFVKGSGKSSYSFAASTMCVDA